MTGAISTIDNRYNYSTTEKIVGRWIDGSKIYRKVITGYNLPTISTSGTYSTLYVPINESVKQYLNLIGIAGPNTARYAWANSGYNQTDHFYVMGYDNSSATDQKNKIRVMINSTLWSGWPLIIIVEYIKTTA